MSTQTTTPIQKANASPAKTPDSARYFYSCAAIVLFVLMFLGFQSYYLHGNAFPNRPIAPPMRKLVFAHGTIMSTWIVLFIVQPILVARGNRKLHMTLGKFGAALAVCVFGLGLLTAIISAKFTPAEVRIGLARQKLHGDTYVQHHYVRGLCHHRHLDPQKTADPSTNDVHGGSGNDGRGHRPYRIPQLALSRDYFGNHLRPDLNDVGLRPYSVHHQISPDPFLRSLLRDRLCGVHGHIRVRLDDRPNQRLAQRRERADKVRSAGF